MVEPEFVAAKVGVAPETGLLLLSRSVIVTVEVLTPSAMTGPVPVIEEVPAKADPAVNVTEPSAFTIGVSIWSVLTSARVDLRRHVERPVALVAEHGP